MKKYIKLFTFADYVFVLIDSIDSSDNINIRNSNFIGIDNNNNNKNFDNLLFIIYNTNYNYKFCRK